MSTNCQSDSTVNGIDVEVLAETISAIKGQPELGETTFRGTSRWLDARPDR